MDLLVIRLLPLSIYFSEMRTLSCALLCLQHSARARNSGDGKVEWTFLPQISAVLMLDILKLLLLPSVRLDLLKGSY